MKETDPRFVDLKKKIFFFFLFASIGIMTILVLLGVERGFFTPKYHLCLIVDKGTGFFEGMPVKLSGFRIGKIDRISLDENAKVKITLVINKKYQKWIRKNSRAMLTKEGLIGESIIDVSIGSQVESVLKDGAAIEFEKARGLDEIAEEVVPVLNDIKSIVRYVNDPQGDVKKTIGNLRALSAELRTTRENLDKLLNDTNKNINNISSEIKKVAANADKTISGIEGKINPVMDKLARTMDNAEKATLNLKDAVEKSAPRVPGLLSKGEDTLDSTNDIVKSLKQIWPIRLYIEEPKGSLLHGDSHE